MKKHLRLIGLTTVLFCAETKAEPNCWAFEPGKDSFRDTALLDLRGLNEKTAGESGFVRVSPEGDFLLGSGDPVRFWGAVIDTGREKPFVPRPRGRQKEPDLARHARFLAKRGVNMVRCHAHIDPKPDQALTDINVSDRDWVWRTVAAMKKEGIYTTISPYWAVSSSIGESWGIPGGTNQSLTGLVFFDEKLQEGYKAWLKALYTEKNPYTGISLAQDPAVAIIQLQNEDSLLFWTVSSIQGEQKIRLGQKFAAWTVKKYGTMDKTFAAWEADRMPGDKPDDGMLDFYNIWEMTQHRTGGHAKRLDDQLQFWSETMYNFNKMIADYLRNELGCKQLINAGNWRTADSPSLGDAERWSYTANEVIAINRYFGGLHIGPNEGWAISNGDLYTSPSILLDPGQLPITLKQVQGRPMIVTESAWVLPNARGAEGPFLIAAYQSLTGVDAYYWFATTDDEWTPPQSANGYEPSQQKWAFATPDMLGNFPAAVMMYRQGYLKKGDPVVHEERALEDIWQRRTPIIFEEGSFDPNRDTGNIAPSSSVKRAVSPDAFLVGPVETCYGGNPAKSKVVDLSEYIDPANGIIRSITGEITLNWKLGWCTVNAPKAQGVAAFFKNQGRFELSDVTITSSNDYAVVLAVSMDNKPLRRSGKVLVQTGTSSRPTGWREVPETIKVPEGTFEGFRVEEYGRAPWQVIKAQVRVTLDNPNLSRATVLDMNGNAAGTVPLTQADNSVSFAFPENAMYVVLE